MNHSTHPDKAKQRYRNKVQQRMPKSHTLSQCIRAFLIGGLICCIGQFTHDLCSILFVLNEDELSAVTSIVMIFLGATLTGIGIYDKIGAFAGAGSVIPITGFANSIVSPAMEFKREGYIFGVGARIFSIAGPTLLFGFAASVLIGFVYYIIR